MRKFLLIAAVVAMLPIAGLNGGAATASGIKYVTVFPNTPQQVEIAVQVFFPDLYDANKTYPALVEVEGYGGAASPNDSSFVNDKDYIVVAVSLRGTGCSAGQLELFSDQSSKDVAWIINNWIPQQTWSNGKAGIYGHSYGGLTGFLVASFAGTEHLKAVAVSGLIDDFYRGILYPGGISNYGFPVLWGAGVRPLGEHAPNAQHIVGDQHCTQNYLDHRGSSAVPPPQITLDTYGSPFTKDVVTGQPTWGIRQGLLNHIDNPAIGAKIEVPIQLGQQYQDEQTGPRGGHVLWEALPDSLPKRISISTGRHNPNDPMRTKKDWLDCWILQNGDTTKNAVNGASCADVLDPQKRVLLAFEQISPNGNPTRPPAYTSSDWPLPETDWQRFKLCPNGTLANAQTTVCAGSEVTYLSTGAGRHMTLDVGAAAPTGAPLAPYGFTTGIPDTARYTMTFTEDTAIAGPLELSLWATLSSPDNNFWVEVLDRDTVTGATTFVQRGMLRAAANAGFVEGLSDTTPGGDIYRPYYKHESLVLVEPNTPTKYEIEIFPLGHVWRANHELVLQLHAPPANDPISTYAFLPTTPSLVTILQDANHPTTLLIPFLRNLDQQHYRATPPACGQVNGEVCVTPTLG